MTADPYAEALAFLADEANAVRPGPGKFEGNGDARIAQALYEITLDSGYDEQHGSVAEEGLWVARVGRFIVAEDDHGFFSYVAHEDEAVAKEAYRLVQTY